VFEVDLAARELRKNGRPIHLRPQPFQVLATLLENPGRVVTRDVFRQIWPNASFVDFDHDLNQAVNKIRHSLGDSSSSPRFIETLARRGYRFIAPIERAPALPGSLTSEPGTPSAAKLGLDKNSSAHAALRPESRSDSRPGFLRALSELIQKCFPRYV
jgi:DNA-binding winged helix-turn-helix (wHTH) protein